VGHVFFAVGVGARGAMSHVDPKVNYECCSEDALLDDGRGQIYQKYVGPGKGAYTRVDDYVHVGQGRGDYDWERVRMPWYRWCLWASCGCFLLSLITAAIVFAVEHHQQVGADEGARYNCYTAAGSLPPPGAKIIELWSNPHKIWCCENMGVACATSSTTQMPTTWIMVPVPDFKEGLKGVPAIAGAPDGVVPFAVTFHCHVGMPSGWSQEQQDFCCKHVSIGCKMEVPPEPNCELSATNDPMHWLPSKREWCCAKHQTGCLQVPSVGTAAGAACEGDPMAWDEAQKTYCCTSTGLGCTTAPPASSELYDCTIGFATWQDDWSRSHQDWCCTHHGRGCS